MDTTRRTKGRQQMKKRRPRSARAVRCSAPRNDRSLGVAGGLAEHVRFNPPGQDPFRFSSSAAPAPRLSGSGRWRCSGRRHRTPWTRASGPAGKVVIVCSWSRSHWSWLWGCRGSAPDHATGHGTVGRGGCDRAWFLPCGGRLRHRRPAASDTPSGRAGPRARPPRRRDRAADIKFRQLGRTTDLHAKRRCRPPANG